jgi:pSer/pThr/pTyr-binding forkhead associated (FHA) protein
MEIFEKINKAFGGWYEGLFGASDDVRPKDILRKILTALEEHRKEGFDNKVYVPNQFILEISVDDEEEKEYLLSFLDREELETAVRRYCQQNHYHIRGGLDFTIKEVEPNPDAAKREKVRVKVRYDSKIAAQKPVSSEVAGEPVAEVLAPHPNDLVPSRPLLPPDENPTVYDVSFSEESESGTVPAIAAAHLTIYERDKKPYEVRIARGSVTIGRSPRAQNDVVLENDGMVSRRHARIELDADGQFTVYDLDTTNGTRVNGRKVDNQTLKSGDEVKIGETRIIFYRDQEEEDRQPDAGRWRRFEPRPASSAPRLVLTDGAQDVDDYVLGTETVIGRAVTNDIVIPERTVATRHARIVRGHPTTLAILDGEHISLLNGSKIGPGEPMALKHGDRIGLGIVTLRFEEAER